MSDQNSDQGGRLSRLVRDGLARERRAMPEQALFTTPRPRTKASALEALIEERRQGR